MRYEAVRQRDETKLVRGAGVASLEGKSDTRARCEAVGWGWLAGVGRAESAPLGCGRLLAWQSAAGVRPYEELRALLRQRGERRQAGDEIARFREAELLEHGVHHKAGALYDLLGCGILNGSDENAPGKGAAPAGNIETLSRCLSVAGPGLVEVPKPGLVLYLLCVSEGIAVLGALEVKLHLQQPERPGARDQRAAAEEELGGGGEGGMQ